MNRGSWNQAKGKAKQTWGGLTDDEFNTIAGKRDELVGRLHHYGISREKG